MGETCNQATADGRCDLPATHRFTWPGRDESFICKDHGLKLKAVADAMGLYVQLIPLPPPPEAK